MQKNYDDPGLRQADVRWNKDSQALERMIEAAEDVPVGRLLGPVDFPPLAPLSEEALAEQLTRVFNLLAEIGVFIDFLFDPDPAEIYEFLTGALLEERIADLQLRGHAVVFIYELANPTPESNAKLCAQTYLTAFFLGHDDVRRSFMALGSLMDRHHRPILDEVFEADIRSFQRKFPKIGDFELKASAVKITGETAVVDIQTNWQANSSPEARLSVVSGVSRIDLQRKGCTDWLVTGMRLAGWRPNADGKI